MKYAYAELSRWDLGVFRLFGPGLGNLLFPWARAYLASRDMGIDMLWPTWPQVKVGPILRGEADRRSYTNIFHNPGEYIDGARKLWLLGSARRVPEDDLGQRRESPKESRRHLLVAFSGMKGTFSRFVERRREIERELLRITRPEHHAGMNWSFERSISVHLRMGDFAPFDDARLRRGERNLRLSLPWVVETVKTIRQDLGEDWPVWVFSDGRTSEMKELLSLPEVERVGFGSSIADILAMSRSNVLVVSSTFSMWGAFLGAVPSVYYPGQLWTRLVPGDPSIEVVREWGERLPEPFLQGVLERAEKGAEAGRRGAPMEPGHQHTLEVPTL